MPAISAPSIILVTGANGFVAVHVLNALLEQGFSVRGTVRSSAKGDYLQQLFATHGERFQYVVIPDVNAPGAFDQAVVGVAGIAHVSAPLPQEVADIEEILKPAVQGTIALFESARVYGKAVKRIVLTSSVAAFVEPKEGPYRYTEADWNESAVAAVTEKGLEAGPMLIYFASKVLQERAAHDFVDKHKGSLTFDLAVVAPGWVVGPMLDNQPKPGPMSVGVFFGALTGKESPYPLDEIVDVRDIAELHVRSLTTEAAANHRFIAVAQSYSWQDAYDAVNALDPKPVGVPVGTPGAGKKVIHRLTYDNSTSRKVLNFEYRNPSETVQDMWGEFVKRGWVEQTVA